jgi:hypothetical protein
MRGIFSRPDRRLTGTVKARTFRSLQGAQSVDLAPVLEVLGDRHTDEPAVVLRLCLMAADEATGEPRMVSSFLRRISMPPVLASPSVDIALEIQGERRVITPSQVIWDETHRVCIVEVAWIVADTVGADEIENPESWPA